MSDEIDAAQRLDELMREGAIARARGGTQGEGADDCEGCGGAIDLRRRQAMPSARKCFDCQEIAEQGRRRNRGA